MEASKLGAGVGADWDSVHESFLFFAQSDIMSDCSEVIPITTLGFCGKKTNEKCALCVCVLAVLIKRTDFMILRSKISGSV